MISRAMLQNLMAPPPKPKSIYDQNMDEYRRPPEHSESAPQLHREGIVSGAAGRRRRPPRRRGQQRSPSPAAAPSPLLEARELHRAALLQRKRNLRSELESLSQRPPLDRELEDRGPKRPHEQRVERLQLASELLHSAQERQGSDVLLLAEPVTSHGKTIKPVRTTRRSRPQSASPSLGALVPGPAGLRSRPASGGGGGSGSRSRPRSRRSRSRSPDYSSDRDERDEDELLYSQDDDDDDDEEEEEEDEGLAPQRRKKRPQSSDGHRSAGGAAGAARKPRPRSALATLTARQQRSRPPSAQQQPVANGQGKRRPHTAGSRPRSPPRHLGGKRRSDGHRALRVARHGLPRAFNEAYVRLTAMLSVLDWEEGVAPVVEDIWRDVRTHRSHACLSTPGGVQAALAAVEEEIARSRGGQSDEGYEDLDARMRAVRTPFSPAPGPSLLERQQQAHGASSSSSPAREPAQQAPEPEPAPAPAPATAKPDAYAALLGTGEAESAQELTEAQALTQQLYKGRLAPAAFADRLARSAAPERTELVGELVREVQQLRQLLSAGTDVGAQLDLMGVIVSTTGCARDVLHCEFARLFLVDARGELVSQELTGADIRVAVGQGAVGFAASSMLPLVTGPLASHRHFDPDVDGRLAPREVHSALLQPVLDWVGDGKLLGVLVALNRVGGAGGFSRVDVKAAGEFAKQVSVAVQNAAIVSSLQRQLS